MTANSSLMQVDAIGDSTQPQSALSALPAQAASSDDCSAVKSPSSDPAQNGATSTPQQPAAVKPSAAQNAHLAAASPKLQQHPSLQLQTAAPSSNWHLRKRKQAPSGEEQQHATLGRSTPDSAAAEQDVAGSTEQDSLEPDLSHRKGKRKGSKVSGGPTEALPKGQGRAAPSASGRRAKGVKSKYDAVVGCTIDVPAPIFGVDIPDLYYRGTVLKKDPAHAGSMVVRFIEDGSRYWFPLAEIQRFLKDMQSKGRDAESDTIGQGSHAFAAQVLAGTLVAKKKASGMTSSSATAGSRDVEVSSGVHQGGQQAVSKTRSPSRFSKEAPVGNAEQETSSLRTLAAAADTGDI